jgi:hypothetical protein
MSDIETYSFEGIVEQVLHGPLIRTIGTSFMGATVSLLDAVDGNHVIALTVETGGAADLYDDNHLFEGLRVTGTCHVKGDGTLKAVQIKLAR